jgi:restriction system protein
MFRWGWNARSGHAARSESHRLLTHVRELSWEAYWSLIADIFRRRGHDVFAGEGPDRDVIDMELSSDRDGRLIVNCQLRGMRHISTAPLEEMVTVAQRCGAAGALLITDGDFSPDAHSFAAGHPLILVDGDALLELVLELTLGDQVERKVGARLAKLLFNGQGGAAPRAN